MRPAHESDRFEKPWCQVKGNRLAVFGEPDPLDEFELQQVVTIFRRDSELRASQGNQHSFQYQTAGVFNQHLFSCSTCTMIRNPVRAPVPRVLPRYFIAGGTRFRGTANVRPVLCSVERIEDTARVMNDETISPAHLLLQYYSALAELEQEGRRMVLHASKSAHAGHGSGRIERIVQPIVLQREMRIPV